MIYKREGEKVTIEMDRDDYWNLLLMLGLLAGTMEEKKSPMGRA
jgi:hypothetical protein